jgi:16S rRNA U1498 N3-methylase RsmE
LNKNKLTDACLPILLELAKVNKVLKKIYISQNNIKERSAREVIKKLKEMGVSLSV